MLESEIAFAPNATPAIATPASTTSPIGSTISNAAAPISANASPISSQILLDAAFSILPAVSWTEEVIISEPVLSKIFVGAGASVVIVDGVSVGTSVEGCVEIPVGASSDVGKTGVGSLLACAPV